jgi:hypothetical protein
VQGASEEERVCQEEGGRVVEAMGPPDRCPSSEEDLALSSKDLIFELELKRGPTLWFSTVLSF